MPQKVQFQSQRRNVIKRTFVLKLLFFFLDITHSSKQSQTHLFKNKRILRVGKNVPFTQVFSGMGRNFENRIFCGWFIQVLKSHADFSVGHEINQWSCESKCNYFLTIKTEAWVGKSREVLLLTLTHCDLRESSSTIKSYNRTNCPCSKRTQKWKKIYNHVHGRA